MARKHCGRVFVHKCACSLVGVTHIWSPGGKLHFRGCFLNGASIGHAIFRGHGGYKGFCRSMSRKFAVAGFARKFLVFGLLF